MKHLGDITQIRGDAVPPVDVIIGGSPCQDLSAAGKRAGLAGERSGLYMEQIRIIKEMRSSVRADGYLWGGAPRYMVWENVPGAFSSNGGEDFRAVLEEAAHIVCPECVIPRPENGKWTNAGCIMGDGWSLAWRVHDAQFWGVPQRRRRIALVADFGGGSAPEILFEREGLRGDSQEGGEARKGTAGDATGGVGTAVNVMAFEPGIASRDGGHCYSEISGTLRAEPGDNRMATCYSFDSLASNSMKSSNPHSGCREVECSKTLDCFDPNPSKNQGGIAVVQPAICIQGNCIDRADTAGCNGKGWRDDDVSYTLNTIDRPAVYDARGNGDGETCPTITGDHEGYISDYTAICISESGRDVAANKAICLRAQDGEHGAPAINSQTAVRRLTPLECERLQGYPDGWTDIGEWVDSKGKRHQTADSARYKALGNSIALPYWRYLLKRISAQFEYTPTMASLFDGIGGFPYLWESINGKGTCRWASEIEEFPMAVTKTRIGD